MRNTNRLTLRRPVVQDAEEYLAFRNSEFVLRYNAMKKQTLEQAERYLSADDDEEEKLMIVHRESGKLIGMVCINPDSLRWGVSSAEISYFLAEAYSRQGYMKEALAEVLLYLFEEKNLECVGARSFAPNTASRELLGSLGFHHDGILRRCVKGYADVVFDDAVYSMMKEEWIDKYNKNAAGM